MKAFLLQYKLKYWLVTPLLRKHKEWEKQYYLSHDCSQPGLEEVRRNKVQYSVYKNMLLCEEL